MIYYLCLDDNEAAGGRYVIYRHVDILNNNGIEAAVLHQHAPFRLTWFENITNVRYIDATLNFKKDDIFVVPETWRDFIYDELKDYRKVVFCQNPYYSIHARENKEGHVFQRPDVSAILTCSQESKKLLEYMYDREASIVRNAPDPGIFYMIGEKHPEIVVMPRKGGHELEMVLGIAKLKGWLDGWTITIIENVTLEGVGYYMRRAAVFCASGYPEGLPAPAMEAMLCGCAVVGYHGFGAKEYMQPEFCKPVEIFDIQTFCEGLRETLELYRDNPAEIWRRNDLAAKYIKENYSPKQQEEELLKFWKGIL